MGCKANGYCSRRVYGRKHSRAIRSRGIGKNRKRFLRYTFKDSSEAGLDASWTELIGASGTTTLLSGSTDAGQGPYDLPFAFELYENEYTTWGNGGDNGYITLGGAISYQWTSYHIPATQLGNAAVAGAWFDGGFCRTSNLSLIHI